MWIIDTIRHADWKTLLVIIVVGVYLSVLFLRYHP